MIAPLALAKLLSDCVPTVPTSTMYAIVKVESGGRPFALHDNTTSRYFYPVSRQAALALSSKFLKRGDSIDLGLAQINSANLRVLGLSQYDSFDPCRNSEASATILAGAYGRARKRFGFGPYALRRALSEYNSGDLTSHAGGRYADSVIAASKQMPDEHGIGTVSFAPFEPAVPARNSFPLVVRPRVIAYVKSVCNVGPDRGEPWSIFYGCRSATKVRALRSVVVSLRNWSSNG